MGAEVAILLVARRRWVAIALGALLLGACQAFTDEDSARVDPSDYDAFFLWSGVRPPEALASAKTIYLHAGEVRGDDNGQFVTLRAEPPQLANSQVWLTVRAERLDWQESIYRHVLREVSNWNALNPRFTGLQIDFDARTRGLTDYAMFLRDLRRRLPARYRLSVTGLMDWSAQGDPAALAGLAGTVDEVVIQTYQGKQTIPGYQAYMASLARLPVPFKIGLVEGGEWRAPGSLASNPAFRGYVVFLINR